MSTHLHTVWFFKRLVFKFQEKKTKKIANRCVDYSWLFNTFVAINVLGIFGNGQFEASFLHNSVGVSATTRSVLATKAAIAASYRCIQEISQTIKENNQGASNRMIWAANLQAQLTELLHP